MSTPLPHPSPTESTNDHRSWPDRLDEQFHGAKRSTIHALIIFLFFRDVWIYVLGPLLLSLFPSNATRQPSATFEQTKEAVAFAVKDFNAEGAQLKTIEMVNGRVVCCFGTIESTNQLNVCISADANQSVGEDELTEALKAAGTLASKVNFAKCRMCIKTRGTFTPEARQLGDVIRAKMVDRPKKS